MTTSAASVPAPAGHPQRELLPGIQVVMAHTVTPQAWRNGGGRTRELLAWPAGQDWQLRISRADIDADGPFSAFPGVERWFTVLEGAGVALHFPDAAAPTATLHAGDAPLHFDGGLAPGCTLLNGATQDLNLMARAGRSTLQCVQDGTPWTPTFSINGLYTAVAGTWSAVHASDAIATGCPNTSLFALPAHSLLWCEAAASMTTAPWTFTPDTPGTRAWWLGYTPDTP